MKVVTFFLSLLEPFFGSKQLMPAYVKRQQHGPEYFF
ncbi:hypothetical protein BH10BAC3_BH10BAC3_26770 [soil metagenome]